MAGYLEGEHVAAESALCFGVLHLDHDALPRAAQRGAVRLPDGGAADGLPCERAEHLVHGPAQLPFDDRTHRGRVTRRDVVEKRLERVHVQLGDDSSLVGGDLLPALVVKPCGQPRCKVAGHAATLHMYLWSVWGCGRAATPPSSMKTS